MTRYTETHLKVLEKQNLNCSDIVKLAGDHVEGELSSTLQARVNAHVQKCERCKNFESSYRHIIGLAAELADKPVPTAVQNRLRKALNDKLNLSMPMV